jgi:hypothetical protein
MVIRPRRKRRGYAPQANSLTPPNHTNEASLDIFGQLGGAITASSTGRKGTANERNLLGMSLAIYPAAGVLHSDNLVQRRVGDE